jgi:nucleotide-binding universal stress UspA family protein
MLGSAKWKDDSHAKAIMSLMIKEGEQRGVCVQPVYAVSEEPSATILDLAATLGVDYIILGASQRRSVADLLKGSVATQIAQNLPDTIRLVIFG